MICIIAAFHVPSSHLPHRASASSVLHAVAAPVSDPGKLLYDAAVDGDLTKMKTAIKVIQERHSQQRQISEGISVTFHNFLFTTGMQGKQRPTQLYKHSEIWKNTPGAIFLCPTANIPCNPIRSHL